MSTAELYSPPRPPMRTQELNWYRFLRALRGMEHLDEAVAATTIQLNDAERRHLEEAYQPHPILGHP